MATNDLIKVYIELDPDDWHGTASEGLWAEPLSTPANAYRLQNSPFFARGISFLDIVRAEPSPNGLTFVDVIEHCGRSTYMLFVKVTGPEFAFYWGRLEAMGCTYESSTTGHGILYSIDVPPSADIYKVYSLLEEGENRDIWMFQEGHLGHALINKPTILP